MYVSVLYVHIPLMSCGCDSLAGVMLFSIAKLPCYCLYSKYIHTSSSFHTSWGLAMGFMSYNCVLPQTGLCLLDLLFSEPMTVLHMSSLYILHHQYSTIIETVFNYVVCTGLYSHPVDMRPALLHQCLVL